MEYKIKKIDHRDPLYKKRKSVAGANFNHSIRAIQLEKEISMQEKRSSW